MHLELIYLFIIIANTCFDFKFDRLQKHSI